jgi:hypothetical protein
MHKLSQEQNARKKSIWDEAVEDAERKLKHTETRSRRLRAAIENFKANRDLGKPWPGQSGYTVTQEAGTAKEAVPA